MAKYFLESSGAPLEGYIDMIAQQKGLISKQFENENLCEMQKNEAGYNFSEWYTQANRSKWPP